MGLDSFDLVLGLALAVLGGALMNDLDRERAKKRGKPALRNDPVQGPRGTQGDVSSQELADDAVLVDVLPHSLDLNKYVSAVGDPGAGAIATFMGITRDNFQGKKVYHLEYEAYEPMARKIMQEICHEAGRKWAVKRIALAHKVGACGVGQTSVIIAVSSAHRKASLQACHWVIDELKARVPIWKKEFYEGGEVWKENAESKDISGAYVMA